MSTPGTGGLGLGGRGGGLGSGSGGGFGSDSGSGPGREASGLGEPGQPRGKALRFLLAVFAGVLVLVAIAAAGLAWYSTTPAFENKVRGTLISTLEDSVGGTVQVGAVRWHLLHLDFEVDNLTIHGLEAATEVPFAHLDRLHVRLKIISLFSAKIGLNYLGAEHPVLHLIVYKDGSTNQPVPRKKSPPSNKSTIDTIFDLAVDRTEIENGVALFNQQAMPFSLAANDLAVKVNYLPARDHYTGTVDIADITAQRGMAAPLHSRLQLTAEMGRNELSVPSLTFTAGSSKLAAHAHVSDFNDPHWELGTKGTVDVREAQALAAVPGLESGVLALDLHGKGTKVLFDIRGDMRLAGVNYKGSGVTIRDLRAGAAVQVTQDEISLSSLAVRLAAGGTIDGDAHVSNWLGGSAAPSAAALTAPATALTAPATASATTSGAGGSKAAAGAAAHPETRAAVSRGEVRLHLAGFTLPTLLSILAPPKYQNLGFATTASGAVDLRWVGSPSDLAADAKIALAPPPQPGNGDVPVNGIIDASYLGRENSVLVRQLQVHTPGTQLQVSGGVGLAAGKGSSLQTSVTVSDLGEFNRALIAAGVGANGKKGTQAIPVQLHGQAHFQGSVTGNLAAPDVKGHFSVNNFDVALNQPGAAAGAQALRAGGSPSSVQGIANTGAGCTQVAGGAGVVLNCTNPSQQQIPVEIATPVQATGTLAPTTAVPAATVGGGAPVAAAPLAGVTPASANATAVPVNAPQTIHFDSLAADAEYSSALISVQSALLVRGNTQVRASGQVHAHRLGRHRLLFDEDSSIEATASIDHAAVTDLLALGGQAVPVTGTLTLRTNVAGTLDKLSGGGHLNIAGGSIYGEPYHSLDADLVYAGRDVGASNFVFLQDGGRLTGNGGFNLVSKQFHVQAQGSSFDLAHLQTLKTGAYAVGGQIAFQAQGSGTAASPSINATVHLSNLSVANGTGGPASTGALDLVAHTQAGKLALSGDGRLDGAAIELRATTAIAAPYQAQARLTLAHFDINPFLELFNVQGVRGQSALAGTFTVEGPLGTPRSLNGDATLSKIDVVAQGIALGTEGGLHATLRDGRVTLDPLHITGGGTDLRAQGSAALFGTARALDVRSTGSLDLKIVHALVPEAAGAGQINFGMNVGGTIEKPDLQGKVTFSNVDASYSTLPNGLSSMNGTLVFDQGRLQVQDLTATSGGGHLVFGGFVAYQHGVYADLSVTGTSVRVRYAGGISALFDTEIRLQGTLANMLVSGGVTVTRFSVGPNLDLSTFNSNGISPPPDPNAFANRVRLDVHIRSSQQLDINNSYAKVAGDINLTVRGTAADPSVLGRVTITEGDATFAGTHYTLQHGDIYFSNPVRIDPTIDVEATAHVQDYNVVVGVHGTPSKLSPTFRSEPPLSEQDIFQLLAVGRTAEQQQIYSQQQQQAGVNTTEDSLLGGALNATVSSRINKLFGGGSVKIDPNFISGSGNSTARVTVQQQVSKNGTATFATNVNSTAQQLIQGQYNLTPQVSVIAVRDESGVFSLILKLHQRYR